jgi:hypothetical protein
MDFNNLELVKEYPNFIKDKYPFRLYRSQEKAGGRYKYHLGFPEGLVKPMCFMLETTPYWGEVHWKEIDGFYLWWTTTFSDTKEPPLRELNRELKWRISVANDCIHFLKRLAKEQKGKTE